MAVNWTDFEPIDPATPAAPKQPAAVDWSQFEPIKPNTDGQTVSGFKRSFEEVPGLAAGVGAYVADLIGATDTRDSLLSYAKRRDAEVGARHQNDAASFTDAWDGKVPWLDFLANSAGYVAGQALQSIATGGLGAVGAKMLAKQGVKELAETTAAKAIAAGASEEAAKKAVTEAVAAAGNKAMTRGAFVGAGAQNLGMELGTIYPAAVDEAGGADNLDGGDKLRVIAAASLAAGVDTAGEAIMASRVLRGSKAGSQTTGIIGRAAREVPAGMLREGATEAVQTGLEHYGAGQPIADEKGMRDIIDSAAVGAVGGGLGGGLAATHRREVPDVPAPSPITKGLPGIAAATNIEDAIKAAAEAVTGDPKAGPTHSDRLASVKAELADRDVMDMVRSVYGDAGTTEFLNSVTQASNPKATEEVRARHLQAVEEALFRMRTTRADDTALPGPAVAPQGLVGMGSGPLAIGLDTTPTGRMRVGPDGVAVPETEADRISTADQVRAGATADRSGLTAQTQRGGEPGTGVMVGDGTLTPGPLRPPPAQLPAPPGMPGKRGAFEAAEAEQAAARARQPDDFQALVSVNRAANAPAPTAMELAMQRARERQQQKNQGRRQPPPADPAQGPGPGSPPAAPPPSGPGSPPAFPSSTTARGASTKADEHKGGGVYTISDAISADGPVPETVRLIVRPDGASAIQRDNGDVIDVTNMIRAGFTPERAIAQSLGDDTSGANVSARGAAPPVAPPPSGPPKWASFPPASGTLGIPRADMPQIKSEHRGAMTNFMNAREVQHVQEEVRSDSLRATQAEFDPAKVEQALGFTGNDRSILVSSDNYILDGHHQWLAKLSQNAPVKVIRFNAPIKTLIALAHDFPSSTTAEGATNGVADLAKPAAVASVPGTGGPPVTGRSVGTVGPVAEDTGGGKPAAAAQPAPGGPSAVLVGEQPADGERALTVPEPPYIAAMSPSQRALYGIDKIKEGDATTEVHDRTTNEHGHPDTAYTPEMAVAQLEAAAESVKTINGKLQSGNRTGATVGQLKDAWMLQRHAQRTIDKSRRENPQAWADYDKRQREVAGLEVGASVLTPYASPEHPRGSPGTIERKFPKNWRIKYPLGDTVLVPPSSLRPAAAPAVAAPAASQPKPEPAPATATSQPETEAPARPPRSFRKKQMVTTQVYDAEAGTFKREEVDAETALTALDEDINELQAFIRCIEG